MFKETTCYLLLLGIRELSMNRLTSIMIAVLERQCRAEEVSSVSEVNTSTQSVYAKTINAVSVVQNTWGLKLAFPVIISRLGI